MRDREELDWDSEILPALGGDPVAFRRFHRCYEGRVRFAVAAKLRKWPEYDRPVDDIAQGVWRYLMEDDWRRLRCFDPRRGVPFGYFLRMVAASLASMLAHKHHNLRRADTVAFEFSESEWNMLVALVLSRDLLRKIQKLVDEHLSPEERRFFVGIYIEGQKIKDVGAELGLKENTSHVRRRRLDKKLHRLMKGMIVERFDGDRRIDDERMMLVLLLVLNAIVPVLEHRDGERSLSGSTVLRR